MIGDEDIGDGGTFGRQGGGVDGGAPDGRATAEAFAREGLIATDIDETGLAGLDAETRRLDVR